MTKNLKRALAMAGAVVLLLAGAYVFAFRQKHDAEKVSVLNHPLKKDNTTALADKESYLKEPAARLHSSLSAHQPKEHMPRPTEIADKDGDDEAEERLAREKWYENMHRAAPGVNWKQMDEEARFAKYREKYIAQSKTTESLANGLITGHWLEKGSNNQAGRMLLAEPDTMHHLLYAASGGGNIWRGHMDGTGWTCLNNGLKFQAVCMLRVINMGSAKRIFAAATNNTCYYTDDEGLHWQKSTGLTNAASWGSMERGVMVNDSAQTIYLLLGEWNYKSSYAITSIYFSADHGASFKLLKSYKQSENGGPARFDIWCSYIGHSGKMYMLNDSVLYKYAIHDSEPVRLGVFKAKTAANVHLAGAETNGNTWLYALEDSFLYASTDTGKTWRLHGTEGQNPYTKWSFNCSEQNPACLQAGAVDCWRTTDSGATWAVSNHWYDYYGDPSTLLHADIQGLQSLPGGKGGETAYICNDGGLYTGDSSVKTVTNLGLNNLNVSQYYSTYTKRDQTDVCYAGAQDQGFQRSLHNTDTSNAFDQLISGDYGHIVSSDDGTSVWTVYPGFIGIYPDAANTKTFPTFNFNFQNQLWMPPLAADPKDPNRCYLGGGATSATGAHLFTFTYDRFSGSIRQDEGTFDFSAGGKGSISAIGCSTIDPSHMYVMTENGAFYASTDGGQNWTLSKFTGPAGHYFYGACILPSSKTLGRLWVSGSGYSNPAVYVSDDDGKTFKAISTGLPNTLVFNIAADTAEKFIFAASELGPYVLDVAGKKWYDMSGTAAPDQTYWSVEYVPSMLTARFATYGRGIWDFKIEHISSGADENAKASLQTDMHLFPNPASQTAHLTAAGLKPGAAEIQCTDITGKVCFSLNARTGNDGSLQQDIDITPLKPGLYLIRLIQNGAVREEKLEVR